ncbi:MAG: sigma-70 family RNA polymerase sigma factor [Acidobacteria bacterium]|nr:sigma-70 family RNA polymerase sigma factor [Acidobacteriota bacterium]
MRTESDAHWVAKARKGDVEAFNQLISRWEKRLYNYVLRLLGNREDSQDVCQEAFLKAYRSLGTLASPEKFPSWLFRIARNQAFSHLRRSAAVEQTEYVEADDWEDAPAKPFILADSTGPRRTLRGLELELTVAQALETLSLEQRETVVLKVYHGFRLDEIAEILGCPLSTVKSRLYAGFAQLKQMLTAAPEARAVLNQRL